MNIYEKTTQNVLLVTNMVLWTKKRIMKVLLKSNLVSELNIYYN